MWADDSTTSLSLNHHFFKHRSKKHFFCKHRFVFCDGGTKKHPKIYNFSSITTAARAFDILVLKRYLEKRKTIDADTWSATSENTTNFAVSEYTGNPDFIELLKSSSRDDIVYGLKAVAKKGFSLQLG